MGDIYIFEHEIYISALEHARMLISSNYLLLVFINTVYTQLSSCLGDLVVYVKFQTWEHGLYISALKQANKLKLGDCIPI